MSLRFVDAYLRLEGEKVWVIDMEAENCFVTMRLVWSMSTTRSRSTGMLRMAEHHANSEIVYDLGGNYARFLSDIGIQDYGISLGNVIFDVRQPLE